MLPKCNWLIALKYHVESRELKKCVFLFRHFPSPIFLFPSLGYGLPDDIVIEKRGKGDTFVDCTGADIKISSIKFVQHGAVEGILSKYLNIWCVIRSRI